MTETHPSQIQPVFNVRNLIITGSYVRLTSYRVSPLYQHKCEYPLFL